MKIGMYSSDEIYEELANGFLHHSMVDAMYFEIKKLREENQQLKKQKDELETSYDILQKNNTTLVKQKEEAYKIADDFYKENQQLKKQKDDVVKWLKYKKELMEEFSLDKRKETGAFWYATMGEIDNLLRMLGEIDE